MPAFSEKLIGLADRVGPNLYLWIAVVVVIPRLVFVAVAPDRNIYGNAPGEMAIAKNMIEGHGYRTAEGQLDSDFNPGYPTVLAACRLLSGDSLLLIKLAHIAFDVGAALSFGWILATTCSTLTALLFTVAFALHPLFLRLANNVNDEPLLSFLVAVSFVALYSAIRQPSVWRFARAGFLLGLAIFTKSTALFLPFFLVVALWLIIRTADAPRIRHWVVYLLASIIILLPWAYRNYVVLGHFAFNVHGIGQNLWFGSDPRIFTNYGEAMRASAAKLATEMTARGIAPPASNNVFDRERWELRMAIQNYKDLLHQPATLAEVLLLKATRSLYASENHPLGQWPLILLQVPTLILAIFGVIRLWQWVETRTVALLWTLYIGYYYIIVSVGLPMVRYFVPAIPFLLAAAAAGLESLLLSSRALRSPIPSGDKQTV